jgi:hypothetical protein
LVSRFLRLASELMKATRMSRPSSVVPTVKVLTRPWERLLEGAEEAELVGGVGELLLGPDVIAEDVLRGGNAGLLGQMID